MNYKYELYKYELEIWTRNMNYEYKLYKYELLIWTI